MAHSHPRAARVTLAINLELSRGRHGASARVELHERADGPVAVLAARGWLERAALQRLAETIADLAARGVKRLVLDCSQLRHVDDRLVATLVQSLAAFEAPGGSYAVSGLSHRLSDVFRFAGCDATRRCWPWAADLVAFTHPPEPPREWAS